MSTNFCQLKKILTFDNILNFTIVNGDFYDKINSICLKCNIWTEILHFKKKE